LKVFDKANLTIANNLAIKLGYNRALKPELLATVPEDSLWAVVFNMPHNHKAGKLTDPHIRCMLYPFEPIPGKPNRWRVNKEGIPLFVDTVLEVFERLPETETAPAEASAE